MSERSHAFKRDWRKILADIQNPPDKQVNAPLAGSRVGLNQNCDADDAGILGDEAFELGRERNAMQGWNK